MLSSYPIHAVLPASDIERARTWYAEKLGLTPVSEEPGSLTYEAGGMQFSVYQSQFAGTAQNTQAEFIVDDLEKVVDELTADGVEFQQYDFPGLKTNEKGIAEMGPQGRGSWFKDSEGNTLAIVQHSG